MKTAILLLIWSLASLAEVGKPALDIPIQVVDGGHLSLTQYTGKIVVLEFLLTTCPHCQACSRELQQVSAAYAPKGVRFLGVAINEMAHMFIPDFVKKFELRFPVGYTHRDNAVQFLGFGPDKPLLMPQLVFIDRAGVVRAQHEGGDPKLPCDQQHVRQQLESMLAGKK